MFIFRGFQHKIECEVSVKVIALDLEGTLISNAVSQIARPGLYDFLKECRLLCNRVVIFTTIKEEVFFQIAETLVAEGLAPDWFKEVEYINWSGATKDLNFICNADPNQVVLVDDFGGYVCPDQIAQWVEIKQYCHPYSETDEEFKPVLQKLKLYAIAQSQSDSHWNFPSAE